MITSFSPATACQGETITITGTDLDKVTSVLLGNVNAASFQIVDPTTITAVIADNAGNGNVTVNGTISGPGTLTVKVSPKPALTDVGSPDPFSSCNGTTTYQLKVSNTSTVSGTGNNYQIDWGDGTGTFTQTDWPANAQTTHTYNAQGYFPIVITITSANGCSKSRTYQFYNGKNPLASFTTSASTTGLCAPAPVEFKIGDWFNNTPGTTYVIDFGDGTPNVTLTHPLNATNTVHLLSHTYNTTSCPAATDFTATLRVINGCFTTTYTLNQIIVRKKPTANFTTTAAPCVSTQVCFTNQTTSGYTGNSCNTATLYSWDLGDGTTSTDFEPPCHTYATAGTYIIKLSTSNTACGSDVITKTVTVSPQSPPPTVTPVSYCQNQTASPLTATGTNLLWYTAAAGGTGSPTAPTPSTSTVGTRTYYVTQTVPGSCESIRVPITVTVNALPAAPTVSSPVQLCLNQTAAPLTATGSNLVWYTTSTGGTGSATAPTPGTTSVGTTTYYVSQATNGCEGPRAAIIVNVNALAVAPTVTSPVIYCQNATASALTASGSGLRWYDVATGGTGSATAPVPSTATPGSTTYYVSQVTGCGESPRSSITVTVNAPPNAVISYTPSIVCNAAGTAAVAVTLSGTSGGTYSITPAGLPLNTTTGEITPAGATPNTYIIRYTIPAGGGCPVYNTTATVTVNGTPNASISYPPVCTAGPAVNVTRTGSAGGTYSADPGLSINATTGVITPATSTPGTYTVTYDIPASGPCPGFTTTTSVTVTLAPSAAISYASSNLCNVVNTPTTPNLPVPVTLTGSTGGTYSVSPATGLSINTTNGTIDPSGATPGTYTIRYTIPGSGGCPDLTVNTTVTVNSTPSANISYPPICTADATVNVTRTGSGGGTYSAGAGLSINATTGAITPGTSTPGTYTVTYDIPASAPCPGFNTTTSVTVTQAPSATISYATTTLCNVNTSNPPVTVTQTGSTGGTYSVSPATGLSVNTTNGTIDPSGATPGTYTIRYTITGTGGCSDFTTTATVTVSGTPTASISYPPICTADATVNVTRTGSGGGTYSAGAGLSINATTGAITPGTSTPGTYTVTYDIPASAPCPGFNTTATVIVTQAPFANISYPSATLCNVNTSNPPVAITQTGTTGGTYTITPATGLPLDPVSGQITPAGATAGTYTITYTIRGTGGCADYSTSTNVTINNAPTAAISYNGPYCGIIATPQAVTRTGNAGGTYTASPVGLSINSTTGAITPSASTPGLYTVTYTILASGPCPGYTATANVQIIESPVVSFPQPSQFICSGETATFIPTSTVANTNYNWAVVGALPPNVNGITSGSTSGNIILSFTNTGTADRTITIRVTPVNPIPAACAGAAYDLTLTIRPAVPAPVTDTAHFCMNAPPAALQASASPGNTLKWLSANGTPLNAAPVINTSNPVQYKYFVSQVTAAGCEGPRAEIVAVVHPVAKIVSSSSRNPTACGVPTGNIVLNLLDLNNNLLPNTTVIVHYKRLGIDRTYVGVTDATGQVTIPLTAGTYTDISIETSGGCTSQPIPDVFVLRDPSPPAQPVAGYNPPICSGTQLTLTARTATSAQAGPIDYIWAGPAFGPYGDTTQNTVVTFPSSNMTDAGTYIVYAVQNNCISLPASFQVTISQAPSKPVISTRTPLCVGDNLTLQATSSIPGNSALNYQWNGPGFSVNSANASINNVKVEQTGIYTITVTSPLTGCSVSTDTLIQVGDYPVVKFAQDTMIAPTGFRLNLVPEIINAATPGVMPIQNFTWTPSQDLAFNDATRSTATAEIKNNICYHVTATNIFGCSGSDDVCIRVFCQSSQVFIPNAFAPTGNVPENRKLVVRGTGINTVKSFRVFNRWGRIVYERSNFPPNSTDFGWDGMVNGRMADTGVYVYTVEVICENGMPYTFKGNVTLL